MWHVTDIKYTTGFYIYKLLETTWWFDRNQCLCMRLMLWRHWGALSCVRRNLLRGGRGPTKLSPALRLRRDAIIGLRPCANQLMRHSCLTSLFKSWSVRVPRRSRSTFRPHRQTHAGSGTRRHTHNASAWQSPAAEQAVQTEEESR